MGKQCLNDTSFTTRKGVYPVEALAREVSQKPLNIYGYFQGYWLIFTNRPIAKGNTYISQ